MDKYVYLLWNMHADSWTGTRTLQGVFETEEAAVEALPHDLYEGEAYGDYTRNFHYFAIEKRKLGT